MIKFLEMAAFHHKYPYKGQCGTLRVNQQVPSRTWQTLQGNPNSNIHYIKVH